jgi:hypothetical protein
VLGVSNAEQLAHNLESAEATELTDEDTAVLDALRAAPEFAEAREGQREFLRKGWG